MDAIPAKLRPVIEQLEAVPNLSRAELVAIVFVVRLGDILHRSFYGTFLTQSLVRKLCKAMEITDLMLEVEVFNMRWSYRQGTIFSVAHRISFDYDMYSVFVMTNIARGFLNGKLTIKEGMTLINNHETKVDYHAVESQYRSFPFRGAVIPLMSFTCATVFFEGTWYDLGFSFACGAASGTIAWIASCYDELSAVVEYLVAIVTAMIAMASVAAFPDDVCFSAQVLGTLYWFFYGTAYVVSLYEITNNQLLTGLTRLTQALVRSYGLAFGVLLGVWFSPYAEDRWDVTTVQCKTRQSQIPDLWFILLFPLAAIASLMQFRVSLGHFVICLVVQAIAYGSQYLIETVWEQPDFLANMIPAYLATLVSAVVVALSGRFYESAFEVSHHASLKKTDSSDVLIPNGDMERQTPTNSATSTDSWADQGQQVITRRSNTKREMESTPGAGEYARSDELDSDVVAYNDADQSYNTVRDDSKRVFAKSDIWFCLLPALYLLVPGSKILQTAFLELLNNFTNEGTDEEYGSLATTLLVIGLGQVIGLRLGFVTLWLYRLFYSWIVRCCECR